MQKEVLALDSLCADAEAQKRHNASPPPPLSDFQTPALELFEAMQDDDARMAMSHAELALNCWLLVEIFGVATRARTLVSAHWDMNISLMEGFCIDGEW